MPTVKRLKRHNGVAGQFAYVAEVEWADGAIDRVEFVGNAYGDGIVMVLPSGVQTRVSEPSRFGSVLDDGWVRTFVGGMSE